MFDFEPLNAKFDLTHLTRQEYRIETTAKDGLARKVAAEARIQPDCLTQGLAGGGLCLRCGSMESGDNPNKKDAGLLQTHAGVDHSVKKIRDQIPK